MTLPPLLDATLAAMVPAWILLKRDIYLEHDASASGGASEAGEESMGGASVGGSGNGASGGAGGSRNGASAVAGGSRNGASAGAGGSRNDAGGSGKGMFPSRQDIAEAILYYLQSLNPDARFASPPELSALRLLRPTESIPPLCENITSAFVASADKHLVALYAGPYRPGTNLKGGYLIYDASKNSLTAIAQPPHDYSRADLGLGAVVLANEGHDDYLLCELTMIRNSDPPQAALCTWRPSSPEWQVEVASFPPELTPPNHFFQADTCFSYQGSILCWVELFKGIAFWDMRQMCPVISFIPLPRGCMIYDREDQSFERPRRAEDFRSIACVGGRIKFFTMDGYGKQPASELSLTIWNLSSDLHTPCWSKGKEYPLKDIWASKAYIASGLPNILPSFPVLTFDEDDVVCLIVTHWIRAVNGKMEYNGQYLLTVDMQHNKVSIRPQNTERLHSGLFASECSAHLQPLEDHQGKVKTRKVGADGKRVVY